MIKKKLIGYVFIFIIMPVIFAGCLIRKNRYKMEYKLDFETEYNQFFVVDKFSPKQTGSMSFWTSNSYDERMALEKGVVGVKIQSYGHVKGRLIILDNESIKNNLNEYDHVVEGGLMIDSGILQVLDCPSSNVVLEINIAPGNYKVRIYSSGISSTSIDDDEGDDFYLVEIWPSKDFHKNVLKQYLE